MTDAGARSKLDEAQELLGLEGREEAAQAARLAREALDALPAGANKEERALAHSVLGRALHKTADAAGAVRHLEEALHLLAPDAPSRLRVQSRMTLASAYEDLARRNDAVAQLTRAVEDARAAGLMGPLAVATLRLAELDQAAGSWRERLQAVEREVAGTPWELLLRLERLRPLRQDEPLADEVLALVRWYAEGSLPVNPALEQRLVLLLRNHTAQLPEDVRRMLLGAGAQPRLEPDVRARLLAADGRMGEAVELLRSALQEARSDSDWLSSANLLLAFLPEDAHDERLRCCERMEQLLAGPLDSPIIRSNLAFALWTCARGERGLLDKAWRHAELAAPALPGDPAVVEVNTRVLANIRRDQLASDATRSTPEQCALAQWFEEPRPLPAQELARYRLHAARLLLYPGPLALPRAVALAERLLGSVPDSPGMRATRARLDWVRARSGPPPQDGAPAVSEAPPGPADTHGPFDDSPGWVVSLAQGRRPAASASLGSGDVARLKALMTARPDRAEDCLDWVFDCISHGAADADSVLALLSALAPRGAVGATLLARVEQALARSPGFPLLRLRVQLLAQARQWGVGTPYARAADSLLAAARTPEERVEAGFYKGVERLSALQTLAPVDPRRKGVLDEARRVLSQSLEEPELARVPKPLRFALLISAGNAFREGHAADAGKALGFYGQARILGAPHAYEAAKLSKVTADALLLRAGPGDAVEALRLLEHSLGIRKEGHYRSETLLSAARAELEQPDRPEEERLDRAVARLEEGLRHCDESNRLGFAAMLIEHLARLARHRPQDAALHRRLDELGKLDPELEKEAARARRGLSGPLPEEMMGFIEDSFPSPAVAAYFEGTRALRSVKEVFADVGMDTEGPMAQVIQAAEVPAQERTPEALRAQAERLSQVQEPERRPGALIARASLLAHLAGLGKASAEETRRAADEAEPQARAVPVPAARHLLLLQLARLWVPAQTYTQPVVDCVRAVKLCREVLDDPAASESGALDALQCLARATRYRTDGARHVHLREAAGLYEQCARRFEQQGLEDAAALMWTNLAEVRAALGTGGTEPEHEVGVAAARRRLALARAPAEKAMALGNLAIELTRLGSLRPTAEGDALLAEARGHFEAMPWADLPTERKFSVENYQTMCLVELANRAGRHDEAIALWQRRLDGLDRGTHPVDRAMTVHNLADTLLEPDRKTGLIDSRHLTLGLLLSEQALQVRTLEAFPEFHWETADNMGRAISTMMLSWSRTLPWPRELWERGEQAFDSAIKAARELGGGQRLAKSALGMLRLALTAGSPEQLESTAERAWTALDGARPFLLVDELAGFEEAVFAADVGARLGRALAGRTTAGATEGFEYVLEGGAAERVLRWLARAAGAAQRTLAGRVSRSPGVPSEVWLEWLEAIRRAAPGEVARALEKVRLAEPSFLQGEPDLSGTWRWLRARQGSAAVALVGSSWELMAVVLDHAERPRVQVAAIQSDTLPVDEATVAKALGPDESGPPYRELLAWTRKQVLTPLERLLPAPPTHLLWIPAGPLRLLAPVDLWPASPVTLATRLDLEVRTHPERPRRTLLAVADPGPGKKGELKGAAKIGANLAHLLAAGTTRALLSQGAVYGAALPVQCPGLVNRPASAEDVLRELEEADVVMFLCHGGVEGPRKATLRLLDEQGADSLLALEQVGTDPRRIAGATVVLLSCETGRVGDWIHRAAGLAGAFLASGARQLIAPLWEVRLGAALQVGRAVLQALEQGEDPSRALHALQAPEVRAAASLKAFVHWVA